ncbi:hypothetical protein FOA52_000458 [Chlamydomonas sp. UWO 241]|nr:hypothetical protein FOA52_000458 [Chlamydomonas sp. UWO 241]
MDIVTGMPLVLEKHERRAALAPGWEEKVAVPTAERPGPHGCEQATWEAELQVVVDEQLHSRQQSHCGASSSGEGLDHASGLKALLLRLEHVAAEADSASVGAHTSGISRDAGELPAFTEDAALCTAIARSASPQTLSRLYARHGRRMGFGHTAHMMVRVAALDAGSACGAASSSSSSSVSQPPAARPAAVAPSRPPPTTAGALPPPHQQHRRREEKVKALSAATRSLWAALVDKALFQCPSASLSQLGVMLGALHRAASAREAAHAAAAAGRRGAWEVARGGGGGGRGGNAAAAPQLSSGHQAGRDGQLQRQRSQPAASRAPLHSAGALSRLEAQLLSAAVCRSTALMDAAGASALGASLGIAHTSPSDGASLARLLAALGRLRARPGDRWQAAFFAASGWQLRSLVPSDLVRLATGLARLQPRAKAPTQWLANFHAATPPSMLERLSPHELTALLVAAARAPAAGAPPTAGAWAASLVRVAAARAREMDAPGLALTLHCAARLRQRRPGPWVEELLELLAERALRGRPAAAPRPEEASLTLRACAMLRCCPPNEWFSSFYSASLGEGGLLRAAAGPQLASIGWALASLGAQPPRAWVVEWAGRLRATLARGGAAATTGGTGGGRDRLLPPPPPPFSSGGRGGGAGGRGRGRGSGGGGGEGTRPLSVRRGRWHGVGYGVHASRAAIAVSVLGLPDVRGWCAALRTPVPRSVSSEREAEHELQEGLEGAPWGAAGGCASGGWTEDGEEGPG